MSDPDIDNLLRSLEVPPPAPESCERALQAGREALRGALPQDTGVAVRYRHRVFVAGSALAAGVFLAFILWSNQPPVRPQHENGEGEWARIVAQEERVLHETLEMFPNNLLAVVSSDLGTELRLSPGPRVRPEQPILVQICKPDGACVRVLSFSGQTVETEVGGRTLSLELLVTGSGAVLICGRDFVWTSDTGPAAGDLLFQAQRLGA